MASKERLIQLYQLQQENPDDPFVDYAIALENHKQGNTVLAIQLLSALISKYPHYLGAYYQYGQLLEIEGDNERALKAYDQGKALALKNGETRAAAELGSAIEMLME